LGTQSPGGGGGGGGDDEDSSSKSKLFIGMAMGFGVIVALVIVLCVVWRFCCKMMNGQATGKVAPVDDGDPENPAGPATAAEDDTEGL